MYCVLYQSFVISPLCSQGRLIEIRVKLGFLQAAVKNAVIRWLKVLSLFVHSYMHIVLLVQLVMGWSYTDSGLWDLDSPKLAIAQCLFWFSKSSKCWSRIICTVAKLGRHCLCRCPRTYQCQAISRHSADCKIRHFCFQLTLVCCSFLICFHWS